MKNYIHIGTITSAHGIKGLVKIRSFLKNPQGLKNHTKLYNHEASKDFSVKYVSSLKDIVIASIDGILTRDEALNLVNIKLFIPRSELSQVKEEEFYIEDLIGMSVLQEGKVKGSVIAVHNFGAGDILEIKFAHNQTLMYSFTKDIFPKIDLEKNIVEMNII